MALLDDYGVCLYLHQHFWGDQLRNFYHGCCWTDFSEELSVGPANLLPIRNVEDKHSRADHILEVGAGLVESGFNILQRLHRLGIGIADAHNSSIRVGGCGSGHVNLITNPHRSRVTHHWFPRCPTRDVLSFQVFYLRGYIVSAQRQMLAFGSR